MENKDLSSLEFKGGHPFNLFEENHVTAYCFALRARADLWAEEGLSSLALSPLSEPGVIANRLHRMPRQSGFVDWPPADYNNLDQRPRRECVDWQARADQKRVAELRDQVCVCFVTAGFFVDDRASQKATLLTVGRDVMTTFPINFLRVCPV